MIPSNRLHGCRLGWFVILVLSGCQTAPLANRLPWFGTAVEKPAVQADLADDNADPARARAGFSDDAAYAPSSGASPAATVRQVAYLADPLGKSAVAASQPPALLDLNPAAPRPAKPQSKAVADPLAEIESKPGRGESSQAGPSADNNAPERPSDASSPQLLPKSSPKRPAATGADDALPKDARSEEDPFNDEPPNAAPSNAAPSNTARPNLPRPVFDLPSLPGEPPRPPQAGAPRAGAPQPGAPQPGAPQAGTPQPESEEVRAVLPLRSVLESVYYSFPALEAAMREADIADGKQLAASGEFDLKIKAESMSLAEGFYDNYRNLVKLEQALMPGGSVYGQYRIGDGSYPEYYRDRETNEGGEFKIGWQTPLMRNRAIDQRRADIFQATLRREQVDPFVQGLLLEFTYGAADAYWSWVAAGLSYDAQRDLLRVTEERNKQFEERVKREDLAAIELVQNERLIASRQAKVVEAERKLQQSAIKLSLFFRDGQGRPVLPAPSLLPDAFPEPQAPDTTVFAAAVEAALTQRPEIRELDLQRQQAEVDLSLGENMRLPSFDAVIQASKDVGAPATKKGDKTPFELEAGLMFELPLQRRKADGKIREANGKLAQLAAKREFTQNKIANQVQDAQSALATSFDRVGLARRNVALARRLEAAERQRFDAEDSDLLRVALQEAAEIEATLLEFETLADYFKARAALRAAMGADPLANNDE
jgi:outer membrane protein TolC